MDETERQQILSETTVGGVLMAELPETRVMAVLSPVETVETTRLHAAEFHSTINESVMADCCLAHPCYDSEGTLTHYCCEVSGSPAWITNLWDYYQANLYRATHTQHLDQTVDSVLEDHGLTSPSFSLRKQQNAERLATQRQEWCQREAELQEAAKQRREGNNA